MKKNIEIRYSRMGRIRVFLFLFVVIVFGVIFILYPSELSGSFIFRTEDSILFAGYFVLCCGLFLLLQYIYLFIFAEVGLEITKEGIINNTTLLYSGIIKWRDIESMTISEKSKNSINVFIKNPQDYIKKTKNPLRKINIYAYYYSYKTPCIIGGQILDIDAAELAKLLKDKWNEYRSLEENKKK